MLAGVFLGKLFGRVPPYKALYNASKDALCATAGLIVAIHFGLSASGNPLGQPVVLILVALTITAVEFAVGLPVIAIVSQTPGAIGYADVAYSLSNHLKFFAMKNSSGKFATPGLKGILAAASSDQKPDPRTNELSIVNPPKKFRLAYPISTFTYVIVPTSTPKAAELRKFLFWAVTKGQNYGTVFQFCSPSTAAGMFDYRTPGCNYGLNGAAVRAARTLTAETSSTLRAYRSRMIKSLI